MKQSELEAAFTTQYLQAGRHSLVPEYVFDEPEEGRKKRMWRFDFANPEAKVGVELDGGEFSQGRHVTPTGFIGDCEKMNAATMQGWAVLRFPGSVYTNDPSSAIEMVDKLIELRLPETDAKEGADITLAEPITVAAIEPAVVSVDVATTEPVAQPDIKLLPAPELKLLPPPEKHFDVGQFVYVIGAGMGSYEIMEVRTHYALKTMTNGKPAYWWRKAEHITLFPWYEKKELKETG